MLQYKSHNYNNLIIFFQNIFVLSILSILSFINKVLDLLIKYLINIKNK
jgi:hypothetical protein